MPPVQSAAKRPEVGQVTEPAGRQARSVAASAPASLRCSLRACRGRPCPRSDVLLVNPPSPNEDPYIRDVHRVAYNEP